MRGRMIKGLLISEIVSHIESLYHPSLKLEFDNPGLHIGFNKRIKNVLVALDPLIEVIDYAVMNKCELIVSHHPIIPPDKEEFIDENNVIHRRIIKAIQNRISVYCCHTPIDVSTKGINFRMAGLIGLSSLEYIKVTARKNRLKLVTFIPEKYMDKLIDRLSREGAGVIGNYTECAFYSKGTGRFKGNEKSLPAIGNKNKREFVDEFRVEMILDEENRDRVEKALTENHPYEEPAYEFYRIDSPYENQGIGIIGKLSKPVKLRELINRLKRILKIDTVRVNTADLDKEVRIIAYSGGSGGSLIKDVIKSKAEVYICGDLKLYNGQEAKEAGLITIDAGHYHTEKVFIELMSKHLKQLKDINVKGYRKTTDYFINA
ncbi:MAG: Nif3-like dinuclear metal center hexameric protein [Candidatus Hydrogenedentota bacterium]